jgi:hypothetical protein
MVDILFASLFDAIRIQNDLRTGNADLQEANESSSRFVKALTVLIDRRIDERNKFNKNNAKSITSINSAPTPLEEIDLIDPDAVREWFRQYKFWYDTRKAG